MNRQEAMSYLHEMGYQPTCTISRKWTDAFFINRGGATLVVLFRSGGVDVFLAPMPPEAISTEEGYLRIRAKDPGNGISEFYYMRNDCNVHQTILQVAQQFAVTGIIPRDLPPKSGISRNDLVRELKANADDDEWLYDAVCPGDGSPGYLGDGVWLCPNGDIHDQVSLK